MRSRWFHRPLLHSPSLGLEKRVTWIELFFDLVFVAAFIQLGNALSACVTPLCAVAFAGVFVPLWVAWSGFTFFENRFTVDDSSHRLLVLAQMFAVGGMAIAAPSAVVGETLAFSVAAGFANLAVALMHLRAYVQVAEARSYAAFWGGFFGAASLLWFAAAFVPRPWTFGLWALATLAVVATPLLPRSRELAERFPIDFEHLGERYGLLTLIVLGESFVKVLGALAAESAGPLLYLDAGVALLVTCGLWWVYFDDVAGTHIRPGAFHWVIWLYAHIPLQLALTATGVAVKKAVAFTWDAPAPDAYRWLLSGSVALVLFSVAMIDSVTERKNVELSDRARVNVRWISALVLLVLAPAGRGMSGGLFVTLVTGIIVVQVVFDMMMAPFAAHAATEHGTKSTAELARAAEAGAATPRPRRDLREAVRKGAPSELRRDLYFYFIEGSWTRVFASIAALFVLSNVFFAALYMLEPASIRGGESFADAFFFSVQTMSTIGYGGLTPGTPYANAVVTVEAAAGIIGVAIVTGLVLAKVSRPRAGVMFSRAAVLTNMDGKRTLMFRVGNARGNEIVDASIDLTVLIEHISPEGHHLRRMHELRLVRPRSPLFVLSWTVMHVVDESSPLFGVDFSSPDARVVGLVATLIGHDGVYGQTTYARHQYVPEDVVVDAHFVDIIHQLPDGRMMVDYTQFHSTAPDAA